MTNSKAILIGFLMVSTAIVAGPLVQGTFVQPAYAQMDSRDFRMFNGALGGHCKCH